MTTLYLATKKRLLPVVALFNSVSVPRFFRRLGFSCILVRATNRQARGRTSASRVRRALKRRKSLASVSQNDPPLFLCFARFPATAQLNFYRVPCFSLCSVRASFRRDSLPSLLLASSRHALLLSDLRFFFFRSFPLSLSALFSSTVLGRPLCRFLHTRQFQRSSRRVSLASATR